MAATVIGEGERNENTGIFCGGFASQGERALPVYRASRLLQQQDTNRFSSTGWRWPRGFGRLRRPKDFGDGQLQLRMESKNASE